MTRLALLMPLLALMPSAAFGQSDDAIDRAVVSETIETTPFAVSEWVASGINYHLTGSRVRAEHRDVRKRAELLVAMTDQTVGSVAFVCADGSFSVRVATGMGTDERAADDIVGHIRAEIMDAYKAKGNPRRTFNARVIVDGERSYQKWIENAHDTMVMPTKRGFAARLYNAAVRGQTVRFVRRGEMDATLALPPPNAAFRDFGKGCGM